MKFMKELKCQFTSLFTNKSTPHLECEPETKCTNSHIIHKSRIEYSKSFDYCFAPGR